MMATNMNAVVIEFDKLKFEYCFNAHDLDDLVCSISNAFQLGSTQKPVGVVVKVNWGCGWKRCE